MPISQMLADRVTVKSGDRPGTGRTEQNGAELAAAISSRANPLFVIGYLQDNG